MNKHLVFSALAAAALLASCSTEQDAPGQQPQNSDVPIMMNLSQKASVQTRAALGNLGADGQLDGTFDTDGGQIGIYCLATDKIFGEEDIQWYPGVNNPNFIWLQNVRADAKTTGEVGNRTTSLEWYNASKYYYPMGSQYAYTIYGYYPYTANVVHDYNRFYVNVEGLDGTTDLIWGKSVVDPDDQFKKYAYSAKYFRSIKEQEGSTYDYLKHLFTVEFKHKLMKFNFIVKKGTSSTDEIKKIGISQVTLHNVATTGKLTIASIDNPDDCGLFEPDWNNTSTLTLKDHGDTDLAITYLGDNDQLTVGEGIMLPVLGKNWDGTYIDNGYWEGGMQNKGAFRLRVDFKNEDDPDVVYKAAQYELLPPAEGWKEGYEYDVVITVSTPLEMKALTRLVPWQKGELTLE